MLITLSGLDGAGKSTLSAAVRARLEQAGYKVTISHMNKQVGLYAAARSLRDMAMSVVKPGREPVSEPGLALVRPSATPPSGMKRMILEARRRIVWNKTLRRLVDLLDLLYFLGYRFAVEKVRGRVLLMDRYFYDRLADQADGVNWSYIRWFIGITPVPDLPVFVDVAPAETFERKGEYSVESMTHRRGYYRQIFEWVPTSVVLPNDNLDHAIDTLERLVMERLPTPKRDELAAPRR